MDILTWLIVGLVAGVLASLVLGSGLGIIGDIIVGIAGAFIGSVVLLAIVHLVSGGFRRRRAVYD